ncbi:hypothetical protein [Micromonospora sp. RTGN7]|uniref:hypothetical protein n=1 Tax=Micromonospora sp. RTGN7 TaxID=3016526 RepID=UPI0029FF562C|nr:hypothetical protein [Micromonospora sp. RTGN7]
MDSRPQDNERLAIAFGDLRAAGLRRVAEPDPDEPRRRAYRRLRNRSVAPAVAVALLGLAGAVTLAGRGVPTPPPAGTGDATSGFPSAWPGTGSAVPTPTWSPSPASTPTTGTPTPSTPATPSPEPTSRTPRPSAPPTAPPTAPSATSTAYVDLSVSAPRAVTLVPGGGAYTGWLDFTVTNGGTRAYDSNDLVVVLPVEATVDLDGTGLGGCFHQGQDDDTKTMFCTGDRRIPVGGSRSYRIGVRVDIAPGGQTRTLTSFALTVRANVQGSFPTDRTPADNTVRTDLTLPAD